MISKSVARGSVSGTGAVPMPETLYSLSLVKSYSGLQLEFSSSETGFINPSQTFDIAIIFERSSKKHAYFWLYNAVWMHLNVSGGGITPARHWSGVKQLQLFYCNS